MICYCCCSVTKLCPTLCNPMEFSTPCSPVLHYLPKFAPTHESMTIQPSHPLLPCSPPALDFSQHQGLFQWLALHIRWPKYCSFSFSISPSNEYLKLEDLNWFDLLAVQGALKSLLQHHSSKASILWPSAFFMVQLSNLHVTTGKIIALTIWTFISKVISLPYNMMLVLS